MEAVTLFKCLSDLSRLKLLLLIDQVEEACVCDLMSAMMLDQPRTSRHLRDLRQCGVVQDQRRGKWVYYRIHPDLPAWVLTIMRTTAQAHPDLLRDERAALQSASADRDRCGEG